MKNMYKTKDNYGCIHSQCYWFYTLVALTHCHVHDSIATHGSPWAKKTLVA